MVMLLFRFNTHRKTFMKASLDADKYWNQVNDIADKLEPVTTLISIDNADEESHVAGRMTEASPKWAAQFIHGKTHRIATQEETDKWQAETKDAQQKAKETINMKGVHIHTGSVVD